MSTRRNPVSESVIAEFLAGRRIALVGASNDAKHFSVAVDAALTSHGYDVIPVNPNETCIRGRPCFPNVADIPGDVDGVLIMVAPGPAVGVLRECITAGITKVWLFAGIGGPGATSAAATALCAEHGVTVVDGACPLMYLRPTGTMHRLHHTVRRWRGDLIGAGRL